MPDTKRTCRYNHGSLELLMGWFALQGVTRRPHNALQKLTDPAYRPTATPNGQLLTLRVWRCPECGYVELVDEV